MSEEGVDTERAAHLQRKEDWYLGIILILALVHGLIYVYLVPPWQHYDEPNHFEYAWLTAHLDHLPQPGDNHPALSRAVVESMVVNEFFGSNVKSARNAWLSGDEPVVIPGLSQLGRPPLYYILASLPLRVMPGAGLDLQFYSVRLVSLLLYLISVLAAWGVARELTQIGNPLRWLMPMTVALLPSFTDLMTAINNDAGAVAVTSLFIWAGVRLIKRGFSLPTFLWAVGMVALSFYTKSTAMITIALLPVALLFSVLRGKLRPVAWSLVALVIVVGFLVVFIWGDAALWYRSTSQDAPSRIANQDAVLGEFVLHLDAQAEVTPGWVAPLFQPIPLEIGNDVRGKDVTLGAWIWASQPVEIRMPSLDVDRQFFFQVIEVSQEPVFYAQHVSLPNDMIRMTVSIQPGYWSSMPAVQIYYDGLILVEGKRPLDEAPSFSSIDGGQGEWGGRPFVNILRNASIEKSGPRLRPWFDRLGARFLPDHVQPSLVITSFLDWDAASFLYMSSVRRLFRTFWATFGWGQVPLMGNKPYRILMLVTLFGGFGSAVWLIRQWRNVPWDLVFYLGLALIAAWGMAFLRSSIHLGTPRALYLPVARYAYPAIIPTVLLLNVGWLEIGHLLRQGLRRVTGKRLSDWSSSSFWSRILPELEFVVYLALFICLNVLSLVSIARFYGML